MNTVYTNSSIFDSPATTLVCPVNCEGVMGAGLAKEFKRRWPDFYKEYRRRCAEGKMHIGVVWLYDIPVSACKNPDNLIALPTKRHWRNPSQIGWISAGLQHLASTAHYWGLESVGMPYVGCGLGGLSRKPVRQLIDWHLGALDIPIYVHDSR